MHTIQHIYSNTSHSIDYLRFDHFRTCTRHCVELLTNLYMITLLIKSIDDNKRASVTKPSKTAVNVRHNKPIHYLSKFHLQLIQSTSQWWFIGIIRPIIRNLIGEAFVNWWCNRDLHIYISDIISTNHNITQTKKPNYSTLGFFRLTVDAPTFFYAYIYT